VVNAVPLYVTVFTTVALLFLRKTFSYFQVGPLYIMFIALFA
jgi:hypothetical protein